MLEKEKNRNTVKDGVPHALSHNKKLPWDASFSESNTSQLVIEFCLFEIYFIPSMMFLLVLFLWEFYFVSCSFSKCLITTS